MINWGVKVEGSNLYWFCELGGVLQFSDFQGTGNMIFPGLWIDVDDSTASYLSHGNDDNCANHGKSEWSANHRGIDVDVELGLVGLWTNGGATAPDGEGPNNEVYNYWCDDDDVNTDPITAVTGGSWLTAGSVLEARVPLSQLGTKVASLPDGANIGDYMFAAVCVQGYNDSGISWGYDVGTPTAVASAPATTPLIPGDANLDGIVDDIDLAIVAANYGNTSAQSWHMGDFNKDAAIDEIDVTIAAANWQQPSSAAVPEPASAILLLIGSLSALALNFRRQK